MVVRGLVEPSTACSGATSVVQLAGSGPPVVGWRPVRVIATETSDQGCCGLSFWGQGLVKGVGTAAPFRDDVGVMQRVRGLATALKLEKRMSLYGDSRVSRDSVALVDCFCAGLKSRLARRPSCGR